METEVAIIGGGLSGLAIAEAFSRQGRSFYVLEARPRLGGRIETEFFEGAGFDLGPAWMWPHNRRLLTLVNELRLELFEQHASGRFVFEDRSGQVRRDLDFATMGGSLRVVGGMAALVVGLENLLPTSRLKLSHQVTSVNAHPDRVEINGHAPEGAFSLKAEQAILALPPRLLASQIAFEPSLPQTLNVRLSATPTWMAGQAKVLAVYDRPFWRDTGLSGDASSHVGPLLEIHDASPDQGGLGALFGFVGPMGQALGEDQLREKALNQLSRLFGAEAGRPKQLFLKDWSRDANTATAADRQALQAHPIYRTISPPRGAWADRLIFAGSETAPDDGGFLEGALASAEAAVAQLTQSELRHEY